MMPVQRRVPFFIGVMFSVVFPLTRSVLVL
jgi:hypothetical protein